MRAGRAFLRERVYSLRMAIVNHAFMPALHQASRHVRAHSAQANHSNLHN